MKVNDKVKITMPHDPYNDIERIGRIRNLIDDVAIVEVVIGTDKYLIKSRICELELVKEPEQEPEGVFLTKDDFLKIAKEVLHDNGYLDLVKDKASSKAEALSITFEYKLTANIAYMELAKRLFGVKND